MLVQLPVWIALYQAVRKVLEQIDTGTLTTININFLGMNLGDKPEWAAFWLVILVIGSMYILQKMSTVPTPDPKQQQMTRIMVLIFPLMFGFITLILPAGLGLYFLVSNIIGIVMQYYVTGWGTLRLPASVRERLPIDRLPAWMKRTGAATTPAITAPGKPSPTTDAGAPPPTTDAGASPPTTEPSASPPTTGPGKPPPIKGEKAEHGKRRDKRKDRGRGHRGRTK
jgi:hypothetical protein